MTVHLDYDNIKANGLTTSEATLLLFFSYEQPSSQIISSLMDKGLLKRTSIQDITKTGVKYRLTTEGQVLLTSCLVNADAVKSHTKLNSERLSNLAKQLKEIFPKGRKEGTNTYWTEGNALIIKRLKSFFEKYEDKNSPYTDSQILNAAKSYVSSFNGDYRFMRVLKYFIFKEEKGADGRVESTSDLVNMLEHAGEENVSNISWMDNVR